MANFKLVSAHYQNFKRHEDVTIDFSETLTVIRGANYKGKSSLLQGIFFALFGLKAVPGGNEIVTRRGSKKKAIVTLVFEDGKDEFTLIRTPTSANLVDSNNGTIAAGGTAVNEWVASRFTDIKKALLLSFSEQGDSQALLALGAGKINLLIEQLSGADYVDRLAKAATDKADKAEAVLAVIGDTVENPDNVAEELSAAEVELERQRGVIEKVEGERVAALLESTKAKTAATQASEANEAAAASNQKRDRLSTRIETQTGTLTGQRTKLAGMTCTDPAPLVARAQELEEAVTSMEALLKRKNSAKSKLELESAWVEKNKDRYKDSGKITDKIEKKESELNALDGTISERHQSYVEHKTALAAVQKAINDSVCSECGRPLDENHLEESQEKLPRLTEATEVSESNWTREKVKRDPLVKEIADLRAQLPPRGWDKELSEHLSDVETLEKQVLLHQNMTEERVQASRVEANYASSQAVTARQSKKAYNTLASEINDLEEEIRKDQSQLDATAPGVMTDVAALLIDSQKKADKLAELVQRRSELALHLTVAGNDVVRLKKALDEARELWQKRLDAETIKSRYSEFAKWLRVNKAAFLSETWAGILSLVTEFTSQTTAGAISEVGRDHDGDFWFNENGTVMPISAASGGQKSIIGTALRCALPSLLPAGLGFVVLDEPSADLDTGHAAALAGALRATQRQVILVTHREGEEFLSDSVVVLDD